MAGGVALAQLSKKELCRAASAELAMLLGARSHGRPRKNSARRWCFRLETAIWLFWAASPTHIYLRWGLDCSALDPFPNAETESKPSTGMEHGARLLVALHAGRASPPLWDGTA